MVYENSDFTLSLYHFYNLSKYSMVLKVARGQVIPYY